MLLPIFSPKADSSNYSFLQTDLLNKTNQLINAINNGHEYWLYSEEECYFLYEKKSNLLDIRNSLLKRVPRKKKFQFTKDQVAHLHQTIEQKEKWQLWLSEQSIRVQDSLKQLKPQYEHLKTMWEKQQDLACYNHTSICAISSEILPKLIKHHDNTRQWLEWQRVLHKPKQTLLNFSMYVDNFQQAANKLQSSLADTMLLRLIAYDESYFITSNPIKYFTCKLEDYGLLKSSNKIIELDRMTDKEFNYFHWYIEKYGSVTTKERLLQLSWYKNKHKFPYKLLVTEKGTILVPEQIASNVPQKIYWPEWMFKSNNLRLNLAQNSSYLVALCNKRREINKHFVDLTLPQTYQYLLEELLAKELYLNDLSKKISLHQKNYNSFIASLFFDKTKSYLSAWQNMLAQINLTIFEDRLLLCEMLIDSVKVNTMQDVIHLDKQYCVQLEILISELERTSKGNKLSTSLEERLQCLKANISAITSFNKSLHILNNIINDELLNADDYDFLFKYISSTEHNDLRYINQMQDYIQLNLLQIQKKLLSELKKQSLSLSGDDIIAKRNCIICCHLLITKYGSDQAKHVVANKIKKYFFNYLQELLLTAQDGCVYYEKQTHLDLISQVLKSVGDTVSFAGKTLLQHLQEIQDVRDTSKTIWQIRCYSLIMTLADELIEARFDKEAILLDEKLFGLLQNHASLRYSDSTIKILQKTRNKLINQHLSCAAFAANLPKAEQVLLGINYRDSAAVQDIILATSDVYKTQKEIQNRELDPIHKIHKIKLLSHSLNNFLQQHPFTKDNYAIRSVSSGIKPWFSKHYLKEEMIVLAKQSMSI